MQEIQVQSLGGEDPLEKGMEPIAVILAWRTPWTEEPGAKSMGWQRVGDWVTNTIWSFPMARKLSEFSVLWFFCCCCSFSFLKFLRVIWAFSLFTLHTFFWSISNMTSISLYWNSCLEGHHWCHCQIQWPLLCICWFLGKVPRRCWQPLLSFNCSHLPLWPFVSVPCSFSSNCHWLLSFCFHP